MFKNDAGINGAGVVARQAKPQRVTPTSQATVCSLPAFPVQLPDHALQMHVPNGSILNCLGLAAYMGDPNECPALSLGLAQLRLESDPEAGRPLFLSLFLSLLFLS